MKALSKTFAVSYHLGRHFYVLRIPKYESLIRYFWGKIHQLPMRHPHPLRMMTMIYDQHFDHCFSLIAPSAFICCGVKVGSLSPECRPTKLASPTQKWMETCSSQNSVFVGTWNVRHDNIKLHILVDLRRNPRFTSRHCFSFCVSELHISAMNN